MRHRYGRHDKIIGVAQQAAAAASTYVSLRGYDQNRFCRLYRCQAINRCNDSRQGTTTTTDKKNHRRPRAGSWNHIRRHLPKSYSTGVMVSI